MLYCLGSQTRAGPAGRRRALGLQRFPHRLNATNTATYNIPKAFMQSKHSYH